MWDTVHELDPNDVLVSSCTTPTSILDRTVIREQRKVEESQKGPFYRSVHVYVAKKIPNDAGSTLVTYPTFFTEAVHFCKETNLKNPTR